MNTQSVTRSLLALAALALISLPVTGRASTIFWGSQFEDLLFDSAGQPLDETYSFEMGSFGSFVPTQGNINEWVNHWKVFDRAFFPDAEGWNPELQFFVGTVEHTPTGGSDSPDADPLSVFAQGEVAYLWVFNTKDRIVSTEWALVTDLSGWVFPDPEDPPGTSYNWDLVDADEVVFGGVNGVQGAGEFTAAPPAFSLQTSTVPVPEPSSGLLMLLGASAWVIRRRSRMLCPRTAKLR